MAKTANVDSSPVARSLGRRIRLARQSAGLTTRQLAERCDVSQPFVSQMENGQAMPSVVTLLRLTEALSTTMQWLIDDGVATPSSISVVRASEGKTYQVTESQSAMARVLVDGQGGFEALEFTATANEELGPHISHRGTDFLHVAEGSLIVDLEGGDIFKLAVGDSLCYPAEIPHRWSVGTDGPARFMCVVLSDHGRSIENRHSVT